MTESSVIDRALEEWLEFFEVSPIDNFSDRLWIGDARGAREHDTLRSLGVTAIVNLTEDDHGAEKAGFKTYWMQIPDAREVPFDRLEQFFDTMDEWWAAGEHIFIHCAAGISRTSSLLIAWLLHTRGACGKSDLAKEWATCERSVRSRRSVIMPHPLLKDSIISYFERRSLELE